MEMDLSVLQVDHFAVTYSGSTATFFLRGAWSSQAGKALEDEERTTDP